MSAFRVICFGEILWDMLPSGKVPGGAPMNVAFQLNQLGVPVGMISRVGNDALGAEVMHFLESKQVPLDFVQIDPLYPTGIVRVSLNEDGQARYEIVAPVAWDFITAGTSTINAVERCEVFVFGSLATRSETSKNTLKILLGKAKYCVLDVNLRPPFFSRDIFEELLPFAEMVKMNDEELDVLAGWYGISGNERDKIAGLAGIFPFEWVIVTRGANGALCFGPDGFFEHPGYKVKVADTVGSGDAFLAGFLQQWLERKPAATCLEFACRMGALVATHKGATPALDKTGLEYIISN